MRCPLSPSVVNCGYIITDISIMCRDYSVCLSAHLSGCLFVTCLSVSLSISLSLCVLLSSCHSADTGTALVWQLHSLETVHPVHKSSASVRKHQVSLVQTLQGFRLGCVFGVCLQLQQQPVFGFETGAEFLKLCWVFGLHKKVAYPTSGFIGDVLSSSQCEVVSPAVRGEG